MTTNIISKYCSNCKETKQLTDYYNRKTSKDGYRSQCKACEREYNYKYPKTRLGLVHKIYGRQMSSSKQRLRI